MAWWHRPIGPMLIRILKPSVSFCGFLIMFFLGIGSVEFSRPVDGTDKQAERVFAQLLGGTRRLDDRSEEHTSELQSLMRTSYAVFCLKKKKRTHKTEQAETKT